MTPQSFRLLLSRIWPIVCRWQIKNDAPARLCRCAAGSCIAARLRWPCLESPPLGSHTYHQGAACSLRAHAIMEGCYERAGQIGVRHEAGLIAQGDTWQRGPVADDASDPAGPQARWQSSTGRRYVRRRNMAERKAARQRACARSWVGRGSRAAGASSAQQGRPCIAKDPDRPMRTVRRRRYAFPSSHAGQHPSSCRAPCWRSEREENLRW